MIGELVPVVMIPRFTSYVGPGKYRTIAMDVSEYSKASIEFWRGVLGFDSGGGDPNLRPTYSAYFEEAHDANLPDDEWTELWSASTVNQATLLSLTLSRRYLRVRIELAGRPGDGGSNPPDNMVAITCWAAGSLEKRVPVSS